MTGKAQNVPKQAFQAGEKISYKAYYNWHFIWIKSGDVFFEVDTLLENNQEYYQFHAMGNTLKAYDLIYKVRNDFYSKCKAHTFEPIEFHRTISHGRNYSEHHYEINHQKNVIVSNIKRDKSAFKRDTIPYVLGCHDMLATAYLLRTLDYQNFETGQIISFSLLVDNTIQNLHFRYLGEEVIKTRNSMIFRCHKISILLMKGDFFPEGEYMKVWLTADKNRIPVMVETKINVGSVKAVLEEFEGIKYPLAEEKLK